MFSALLATPKILKFLLLVTYDIGHFPVNFWEFFICGLGAMNFNVEFIYYLEILCEVSQMLDAYFVNYEFFIKAVLFWSMNFGHSFNFWDLVA